MALGRAPGLDHRFALERWPDFNGQLWNQALDQAGQGERDRLVDGSPLAAVQGLELDAEVAEQAQANAQAAGVDGAVSIQCGDFRNFQPPAGPGVLVCNPPYGERIGEHHELEQLYADLGRMVKERCSGWDFWLLSGNPELTGALRMKASRRIPVSNGGIDCRWLHYAIR